MWFTHKWIWSHIFYAFELKVFIFHPLINWIAGSLHSTLVWTRSLSQREKWAMIESVILIIFFVCLLLHLCYVWRKLEVMNTPASVHVLCSIWEGVASTGVFSMSKTIGHTSAAPLISLLFHLPCLFNSFTVVFSIVPCFCTWHLLPLFVLVNCSSCQFGSVHVTSLTILTTV